MPFANNVGQLKVAGNPKFSFRTIVRHARLLAYLGAMLILTCDNGMGPVNVIDVSGRWLFKETPNSSDSIAENEVQVSVYVFSQQGDSIIVRDFFDRKFPWIAKLNGSKFTREIRSSIDFDGCRITANATYSGTFNGGNMLTGTIESTRQFEGSNCPGDGTTESNATFTAEKFLPATEDISGEWQGIYYAPTIPTPVTFNFEQDGIDFTGSYSDSSGGFGSVTGMLSENRIPFWGGIEFNCTFLGSGVVIGDTLTFSYESRIPGCFNNTTITGTLWRQ